MKILVTGGLGFIGSHTVVALQNEGFEVVIIDNLSNSSESVLSGITAITKQIPIFENIDLRNKILVQDFFKHHQDIEGVIHFAASKAVNESIRKPLLYYENNLHTLIYILQQMSAKQNTHFIFSSSCTVYSQTDILPVKENDPIKKASSVYGNTKQIGENIIRDVCYTNEKIQGIVLRYFNPVGAHQSAKIGELPKGVPQNLIPFITQTAIGLRKELLVFGDDYPTKDGTCIRDYIHVVDLAAAHVAAIKHLFKAKNTSNFEIFNIGTGMGNSVLDVINSFEKVSGEKINWRVVERRKGDIPIAYADTKKAESLLEWKAKLTLDDAMAAAWKWEQKIRKKNILSNT